MMNIRRLSYTQDLSKDLRLNQYEFNEMLLYVENEFHINIEDNELPAIHTIGDLVYCVEKHRN